MNQTKRKIRLGFVSNSSSSSFICVFAKVNDVDKTKEIIDKNMDYEIVSGRELLDRPVRNTAYKWIKIGDADWASVDVEIHKDNIEPEADYLIVNSYGGAGDCDDEFLSNPDDYDSDLDYDVDLHDFRESETIDKLVDAKAIEIIECEYGAGRNG